MTGNLETALRSARAGGRKILVPYITGGFPGWIEAIEGAAAAGADAVEVGIPFSDPVMDGPVIQQASQLALRRRYASGDSPPADLDSGIPVAGFCTTNPCSTPARTLRPFDRGGQGVAAICPTYNSTRRALVLGGPSAVIVTIMVAAATTRRLSCAHRSRLLAAGMQWCCRVWWLGRTHVPRRRITIARVKAHRRTLSSLF